MNEIKKCSIAGVSFTLEYDAYDALNAYIESLNDTYKDDPAGEEIIADIEARIAELILSAQPAGAIIARPLIDNIIKQLGSASEIDEDHEHAEYQASTTDHNGNPAHPAPTLPRHAEPQAGRRMRRSGKLLRRRSHMDTSGHVRAAAAHRLRVARIPLADLVHTIHLEPLRSIHPRLHHHVVRRAARIFGPTETRDEGRAHHRPQHPREHPPPQRRPTNPNARFWQTSYRYSERSCSSSSRSSSYCCS